jgi:hypothetical protein
MLQVTHPLQPVPVALAVVAAQDLSLAVAVVDILVVAAHITPVPLLQTAVAQAVRGSPAMH